MHGLVLGWAEKLAAIAAGPVQHLAEAVRLLPTGFDRRYNPADMQCSLGEALMEKGDVPRATACFNRALELEPKKTRTHYLLPMALAAQGKITEPLEHYAIVKAQQPELDTSSALHLMLAVNYGNAGQTREALASAQKALQLARQFGPTNLLEAITERIGEYQQKSGQR